LRLVTLFTCSVCLLGVAPISGRAQPAANAASKPPPSDQTRQLQTCREGLLDPLIRADDRRRWAQLLLSYDSSEANAIIVELLRLSDRPEVQAGVCVSLIERSRVAPQRLHQSFVEPLIELLEAESEELRALAAQALAEYSSGDVQKRLAELAKGAEAPMSKRLAAINALAPSTHRREVVGQLVDLMSLDDREINAQAAAALEPLAPQLAGRPAQDWTSWWQEKSKLSEDAWLAEQLQIYRDRSRRVTVELQAIRNESERQESVITVRIREFQRELLRSINPEQRDAKLVEWIDDPLPAVKLAAIGIISSRITDEGRRPEKELLAALIRLLRHDALSIRRESLLILQNLNDAAVVDGVLARLAEEKDSSLRQSLLQALGKLASVNAIPALNREIASLDCSPDCAREAALALGQIAVKPEAADALGSAVVILVNRYRLTPQDHGHLRAALLTAMASIGDPSFTHEFASAIESDDAMILPAALRGLRAVGDLSKLPRLRTLTAHAEPRVRIEAIEAISQLGNEDADLEVLLARLGLAAEPNESVREAAWRGFRQLTSKRSLPERIRAADRLREMPDLSIKYLEELAAALATNGNHTAELDTVRDRLAATLAEANKHTEATVYLRALYESRLARGDDAARAIGLRWLESSLRNSNPQSASEVIIRLAEASDAAPVKGEIVRIVAQYLETITDAERGRKLVSELRSVPSDLLGDEWTRLVLQFAAQFEAKDRPPTPTSAP